MEVRKEGNRTVIDLTNDERFNKFLEKRVKDAKRDRWVMRIVACMYLAIIVLLLFSKFGR